MTAFSWVNAVSADWSNTGDWSPAGPPNAATADATIAVSGAYTVTIATTESFLVDSLTFDPATSGVLALNGKLTLGGTEAEMTESSGIVKLAGTIAGGTLSLTGGVLDDTGTGVITSATYIYGGGTVAVASGKTLTLAGATTLDGGAQINGPGTLATTGSTSIIGTPQLDGALVWDNTGTVSAGAEIYTGYPSGTGKVTINNQAGGAFDLTADGEAFYVYSASTLALSNAGVLSKIGGTGTSNVANAVTNTGTITATSGTLELDDGGTLGGTVTETTTGAVTLGAGLFALTGTVNGAGTLTIDSGATLAIGTVSETIADPVVLAGTITIASGKTLTLSGPVTLDGGAQIDGPGTLVTTGATTINATPYHDGSLVWDNSGTVSAGAEIYTGYPSGTGKVTINNQAGGAFDLTADGEAFYVYSASTLALSNAGVLSKIGGTGTSNVANAVTNTGTITATAGTLELDGGGTLGGTVTETTTGAVTLGTGLFALTGTVNGAGTLTIDSGATLAIGTVSETIADAVVTAGTITIASGKTLTLSGPVTLDGGAQIDGPGTLVTTGATTINATPYHDGSLVWGNSGTVSAGAEIYTGYPSGTGKVTINNQAGGAFDLTADGEAFLVYSASTLALSNAGVLSKTGGTGTSNISVAVVNTGTITATSGRLELDGGGTLAGTMGATGAGAVALGAGTFTVGGTAQTITGALTLDGGTVDIASGKTLTLSGAATWYSGEIVGPGTLATTGTMTIGASGIGYPVNFDGGLTWTNSGTVLDGNYIQDGYNSASNLNFAVINKASGVFDFTSDGFNAFNDFNGATTTFANAGLLEKTAGNGTVNFDVALTNTGTVASSFGVLEFTGGGTLGGTMGATGTGQIGFGGGTFTLSGTKQTISGPVGLFGGVVDIASGQTLTLPAAVTWDGGDVAGPGTLATTGTTTIGTPVNGAYIDGGLTWINSGMVLETNSITVGQFSASGLNFGVVNQVGAIFNFTTDGFYAFNQYYTFGETTTFTNAGLLEKTAGTGDVYFGAVLINTGTVTAASGTLQLGAGGMLGGKVGATGTGQIAFVGGTYTLSGATQTITGALGLDGGTVDIASSKTLTLSGAVTWDGGDVAGPGTLATTGTTTISSTSNLDGGLTWTNSGTVFDGAQVNVDAYLTTSTLSNAVVNQATGVFDFTSDGFNAFYDGSNSTAITFTNAGLMEKTAGTGILYFDAALTNTGTVTVSSGTLELQNGGTLGGKIGATGAGEIAFGGGTFTLGGATQIITGAVVLSGGYLNVASGHTLTLTGPVTWNETAGGVGTVGGPGTLATTGTTTLSGNSAYLDGGLTWSNSGTVLQSINANAGYYSTNTAIAIVNQAGGIYNFTADGFQAVDEFNGAITTFTNAGLLEKTAGTGSLTFDATLTNTGTVTASSGILEFTGGGTLGGKIGATGSGAIEFGGGTFTLSGATQTVTGPVVLSGGTMAVASGQTLTLSGAVTWDGCEEDGPGTLATTGTTTISGADYVGAGLTWINSGLVLFSYPSIYDSDPSGSNPGFAVINQAGGTFDFTTGSINYPAFDETANGTTTFTNAGLLETTAGTDFVNFDATLNNTGTVLAKSGTFYLNSGGTLGGLVTIAAGATLAFANGAFAVTGTLVNGGSLVMEPAGAASTTVTFGATKETIAGAVGLYGGSLEIASAQTLTLSGAVNWGSGYVVGPGTLATTGTTTLSGIGGGPSAMDGGLTWTNSGTVLDGSTMLCGFYDTSSQHYTVINQAGGIFDFTSDGFTPFNYYNGATSTFTNASLLEKTAGTGTVTFNAALNNTSTVTSNHGTLDLTGGGILNGTIGGTGAGLVLLDGTTGQNFVTTGTLAITDAGASNDLRIGNGGTLTDSGRINDSGHFVLGNSSGASALVIAAGGKFYFTADDGQIVNGVSASISNAGTLGKIGGTGTSTVGMGFANTGTVDAASGTLKLAGAVSGTGRLQIEAGDTLELANGGIAGNNTIDFNGLGATLKIDTNSTVTKPIIGLGIGSRIDLAAATGAAAVINGNTLTITPTGGTALNFVSTSSLAGLHVTTGSDGGAGTVVTLYGEAAAAQHTPEPVAFGNVHVGATAEKTVSVTNSARTGIYTEKLDGSLTSSAAGFTATGSFTGLAAGATNSSALSVTLNTLNSGTIAGTGTLTLNSDGAGIDGYGTTALPTQTVNVTGAVYAYAAPNPSTTTLNFGATRVGDPALAQSLRLGDGTVANAYQESLVYSTGAAPSEFSITNGSGTIASGSSVTVGATLATGTAGDFTGSTISLGLTSTGVGTSGLADTPLTAETVTLNGKVYATAVADLSATSINFAVVHVGDGVGDVVSQNLSVTNVASGALTDSLTGGTDTLGGNYAGPVGFSLGGGLAAGASGTVSFGLSTAASGVVSGNAALGFTSHDADLADLAINGGTVTVSATVDNYATAQIEDVGGVGTLTGSGANYALNLGSVIQGGTALVGDLGVLNAAPGLADLLSGTFAVAGASTFNNTGFTSGFSGLGAGQDERDQVIALNTGTAGVFTETIVLTPTGSNADYSKVLANETIAVTGTIIPAGVTYMLTGAPITISAGIGNDVFIAENATLNSHDYINGGGGTNTVVASGAGSFDLGAPAQLVNIQVVDAAEGQAGGTGVQTIYMRNGENMTVNVASGTPITGNTNPEAITIYGAAASNVYNLGGGTDTVVLGGAGEAVNGGGGTAILDATTAFAGALINGGTGTTTLTITNGGTATLNAADNHLTVDLTAATNLTLSKMSFITAEGSTGNDTITAMAQGQTLTGGGGTDKLIGYSGFGDLFSDTSAHLNTTTIGQFGGSDVIDLTDMNSSLIKPLAYTGTTSSGTLTVSDGTHTAKIKFTGDYTLANFQPLGSDGHTGSLIGFH